jgi:serine/threonine-protein kinase ATR
LRPDERKKANATLRILKDKLPPYIWLSVFSQLVSRICHPDGDILNCLKEIIAKVLYRYFKCGAFM